jgi:hypothetical protein
MRVEHLKVFRLGVPQVPPHHAQVINQRVDSGAARCPRNRHPIELDQRRVPLLLRPVGRVHRRFRLSPSLDRPLKPPQPGSRFVGPMLRPAHSTLFWPICVRTEQSLHSRILVLPLEQPVQPSVLNGPQCHQTAGQRP